MNDNTDSAGYERRRNVNIDFCNERHKAVDEFKIEIRDDVKAIFIRLNWFYVISISTLCAIIYNIFRG